MNIFKNSNIQVNGNSYSGNSGEVSNGKIIIDGVDVTPDYKNITIVVEGDLNKLDVKACKTLEVGGSVGSLELGMGDIKCGSVAKDAHTGQGDIQVTGDVQGNVKTGMGNVKASKIVGNAKTGMGYVNIR